MTNLPRRGAGVPSPAATVRFAPPARGGDRSSSPSVAVGELLAELAAEVPPSLDFDGKGGPVRLAFDIPADMAVAADRGLLSRVAALLLERSLTAAGRATGGPLAPREVLVTAVACPDRVEIEFADSGAGLTDRERNSLSLRGAPAATPRTATDPLLDDLRHLAMALGASVTAVDCPDGGSAVTLCLPTRPAALRRAA